MVYEDDAEMLSISKARLDQLLQAEVAYLATVPVEPVSITEILAKREPNELVKLIQSEVPKRYAMRLRMIEGLSGWQEVPQLKELHNMLRRWYQMLTLSSITVLKHFTARITTIRGQEKMVVLSVAAGIRQLRKCQGGEHDDDFLDRWIDAFLLLRIGSNMLLGQYMSTVPTEHGGTLCRPNGLIDVNCCATTVCQSAALLAQKLCMTHVGKCPEFEIRSFVYGKEGDQPMGSNTFSYIPGFLRYIVMELMKNSFNATVKNAVGDEMQKVRVIVCCDSHRVAIRISDRGGGIPFDVGDRIWSYLYGAAADGDQNAATNMGGYGVGLPLSRLHAVYLGGKLHITTYPGHGTDAHLLLPRLGADQTENMPLDKW